VYDATAKLPSGILSGNVNQLGDFDECLAVDVHLRARGSTATADTSPASEPLPEDVATSAGGLAGFLQRVASWGAALVKAARGASGAEVVHVRGRYCLASVDVDVLPDPRRSKADQAALYDAVQRALSYRFLRGSINDVSQHCPTSMLFRPKIFFAHCNFLRWHFQPFGLNFVLPSVVKPSGEIAERGKRHPT